jgi:DNA-binding response OmpR family regulator
MTERQLGTVEDHADLCYLEESFTMGGGRLTGCKVLIVEDDPLIAMSLETTLCDTGAEILGPAHTVAHALKLIDASAPDAAILDYRLEKETSARVAARLNQLQVPFLFYTSFRGTIAQDHPGVLIIDKPTEPDRLVSELERLTTDI